MHLPDGSRAHAGTRLPMHTHCFLLQAPESSFRCVQTTDVQRPQATRVGQFGSAGDLVSWDQLPTSDRQDLENKNPASSNVRWASLSHVLPGFSEVPIRTEPWLPTAAPAYLRTCADSFPVSCLTPRTPCFLDHLLTGHLLLLLVSGCTSGEVYLRLVTMDEK